MKLVIFGLSKESMKSVTNFVILAAKGFIWKSRHEFAPLLIATFKKYLKAKLEDLKHSLEYTNEIELFAQWINMFASL